MTSDHADVTIIDYDAGNLLSVERAFSHLGFTSTVTSKPEDVSGASRLVLPGVGAFGKGMDALNQRGLVDHILEFVRTGRPFLGICLGMQMMMEGGTEFGQHRGLGLIQGDVLQIPATRPDGTSQKRPHIGWNPITPANGRDWQNTIFEQTPLETNFYFVHSFAASPVNESHQSAVTDYNGTELTAAIQHKNIIGVQFHPEKSGPAGLNLLQRFMSLD
jgi:imidazole glycerol-phosphate synthase subunit HisH